MNKAKRLQEFAAAIAICLLCSNLSAQGDKLEGRFIIRPAAAIDIPIQIFSNDPRPMIGDVEFPYIDSELEKIEHLEITNLAGKHLTIISRDQFNFRTLIQAKLDDDQSTIFIYGDLIRPHDFAIPLSDWQAARNLIGKPIWRSVDGDGFSDYLPQTPNLAKFFIYDVQLNTEPHGDPFRFWMKTVDGRKGCWHGDIGSIYRFWHTINPKTRFRWPKATWVAIERRTAVLGMSPDQARLAWGGPMRIHRTTNRKGIRQQWVYRGSRYLYFDNGILASIQD